MKHDDCPFCTRLIKSRFYEGWNYYAVYDEHPVVPGHTLLIPVEHFPNFFDRDLEGLVKDIRAVKKVLKSLDSSIEGFNLGVNEGEVAGQTVMHAHLHIIPRRKGDCADPRGGIRLMFGEKGNYLK